MGALLDFEAESGAASARREAEADPESAVAALDVEAQPLALALPGMFAVGRPAELRQACRVEMLDGGAGHLAARLDLDDAALRLVEDDERLRVVVQPGH